jgi:potassium efflux system protein
MSPTPSLARLCVLVLLLLVPAPGGVRAEGPPASGGAPGPAPAAIPLPEVAARATEVDALLQSHAALLSPAPAIATIERELPAASALIDRDFRQTIELLRTHPALQTLEAQEQIWAHRQQLTSAWLDAFTRRATHLQAALTDLGARRRAWTETRGAAVDAKAPEATLGRITEVLAAIEAAEPRLRAERARALDLQERVAREVARCQIALGQIGEAQGQAVRGLLGRDHPPIWSPESWARVGREGLARPRDALVAWWRTFGEFVRDPASGLLAHAAFFVVLAALLWAARRWTHRSPDAGSFATAVFDRPYSAALLLSLSSHPLVFPPAPPEVQQAFSVALLVPMIRLTQPVVHPRAVLGISILAGLFTLDAIRRAVVSLGIEPVLLSVEMLAGIVALGAWLTASRRRSGAAAGEPDLQAPRVVAAVALSLFAVTLAATLLGYLRLGRLLASGVLGSAYLALLLRPMVRVVTGLVGLVLRIWPVRLLRMVQNHRDLLARRTGRVLAWIAFGLWLVRSLDYMGLMGPARTLGDALLSAKVERGALSLSVADVLAFVLTLWVAYVLSAFLRFLLEEDIYPRTGLARGLSYALSSLLNYVLLTLGFLAGLAVLGLDLTRVTILASAFSVGIGFGLQSVVNNFVSGLILLFERPIHVGDVIEAGGITGTVRRIGIRSSVVRTGEGAELIVPNSQLVTERVTNWTLSDQLRRIQLPVGVSYSAHPAKVMEVLESVARAHPHVLRQPAPKAFFTGFGDSSIDFELRAWTDRFDQWFQIRSELMAAIFDAGQDAGISFPFPQREVRVLQDRPARPDEDARGTPG